MHQRIMEIKPKVDRGHLHSASEQVTIRIGPLKPTFGGPLSSVTVLLSVVILLVRVLLWGSCKGEHGHTHAHIHVGVRQQATPA